MTFIDRTGLQYNEVTALYRAENNERGVVWVCECKCGRIWEVDAERLGRIKNCGRGPCHHLVGKKTPGPLSGAWKGDEVGYFGMHRRLRRTLGVARDRNCVDCLQAASDWSYDGLDPDERIEPAGSRAAGFPFSLKPEHYQARCKTCHNVRDHRSAVAA